MKIFKYLVFSVALLGFAACQEVDISERDQATRVTLSPLTTTFDAKATTYVAAVQVNSGSQLLETSWNAEVTSSTPWVTLSKTSVEQSYTGTYDTETVYTSNVEGISVSIAANTEYKRTFEITVTTADGTAVPFTFTQKGAKADAKVTTSVKKVEFLALGGSEVVSYSSNMGDVVAYSFKNGDGSAATWLKAETVEAGKVKVTAEKYENKEAPRSATMTITVGSAATSLASVDVPVTQLAAEDHYFVYGASVADIAIEKALQMDKTEKKGVFTLKTFFNESETMAILINKDSRELTYPCFALAAEGKVVKLENKDTKWTGPAIEANGVRTLTIDFNALTWSWERVTNQYAMPDEEFAKYPTKAYIARDGSMKVWMVKHMAWDGGDIMPKLGSGMHKEPGAPDAYAAAAFPRSWNDAERMNPAWETKESGMGTLETYSDDGRIYAYHEVLGYEARFGIGYARYETTPWIAGEKYTDARGTTYTIADVSPKPEDYSGNDAADEEKYPMLKVQAQGICPYGWHVSNAADWVDLFYAMGKASETGTHSYPVKTADCTYKKALSGVPNMAAWLRNTKDWSGNKIVDEGADEFGFNYFPLGVRYMTWGFSWWTKRAQVWVAMPMPGGNPADYPNAGAGRINVVRSDNNGTTAAMTNMDVGQGIMTFRCVKNYK